MNPSPILVRKVQPSVYRASEEKETAAPTKEGTDNKKFQYQWTCLRTKRAAVLHITKLAIVPSIHKSSNKASDDT